MKSVSIVVPTYNERENLPILVEMLIRVLRDYEFEIIVVDDSSPDGTGAVAEQLSRNYENINVIHRKEKRGLASAVIEGFSYANKDVLGTIDADLQHPPEMVCEMIKEIQKGGDIVIASRYREGGCVEGWSRARKFISKVATLIARIIFPKIKSIRDPLSGFFMLKRGVLEGIEPNVRGFKILLEILVRGSYDKVVEIPYVFRRRKKGKSKLGYKEYFSYLRHTFQLAKTTGEMERFFKFCLIGLSGIWINEFLLWFFTEMAGLFYLISAIFSVEAAIISNFFFNELWTFKDMTTSSILSILRRAAKFNLVRTVGLAISIGTLWVLTNFFGFHYLLSNIFAIAVVLVWNYSSSVFWVWRTIKSGSRSSQK